MQPRQPFLDGPAPTALLFDLMGTCVDWKTSILAVLRSLPPPPPSLSVDLDALAAAWRAGFFAEIHRRFAAKEEGEDIDVTHRRVLERLLEEREIGLDIWDEQCRQRLVKGWHHQTPWPDSLAGISRLKSQLFVVVLANGTTRLQLDIAKSSGLPFHALFASQLLGLTKPDPAIYLKALELMDVLPSEAIMVAAHAYDLRAAAKIGMRTVYIHRTTEDLDENMRLVEDEFDGFIEGGSGTAEEGLVKLAQLLGA